MACCIGAFEYGRRTGEGVMTYPNGDVYQGQWRSDARWGQGRIQYGKKKGFFEGVWEMNQPRI